MTVPNANSLLFVPGLFAPRPFATDVDVPAAVFNDKAGGRADGDVVRPSLVAQERILTKSNVVAAVVVKECTEPNGGIIATSGIADQIVPADSRILFASGVARKSMTPSGSIVPAESIVEQRAVPNPGIVATGSGGDARLGTEKGVPSVSQVWSHCAFRNGLDARHTQPRLRTISDRPLNEAASDLLERARSLKLINLVEFMIVRVTRNGFRAQVRTVRVCSFSLGLAHRPLSTLWQSAPD